MRISAKKARILKNVMLYNFFTFLFERSRADHGLMFSDLGELWRGFKRVFLFSVAVLRSVVGAESVRFRQAARRSGYIYMYLSVF